MMRTILATGVVCVLVAVGSVVTNAQAGAAQAGSGAQAPPQNLQVLPKTMTRQEVTALMRTVTAALGVQCNHCHVGSPADRAKDDLPAKLLARKMFAMTMTINNDLMKDIGTPAAEGKSKVTCFTCHRGALKPLTAAAAGGGF
jgi:hypothetical protein